MIENIFTQTLDLSDYKILGDGAIKDNVIKLNYIFTISEKMIEKSLFHINEEKKKIIKEDLIKRIS